MVKVKICGITNLQDALVAVEAGADMLGFVFAPSPRMVSPEQVKEIISGLSFPVTKVGVFVDNDLEFVRKTMSECSLDSLQFHGTESPEYCTSFPSGVIKAFRVRDESILDMLPLYQVDAFLLDSYDPEKAGGTGRTFNWSIARDARKYGNIILSGGLTPENVAQAITQVEPHAVDVSSGVEVTPGKKDPGKIMAFIQAVRSLS